MPHFDYPFTGCSTFGLFLLFGSYVPCTFAYRVLFCFLLFRAAPAAYEVPRLGVWSELQLLAYTTAIAKPDLTHVCNLRYSSQQSWILNPRPGIEPETSWFLVGFISAARLDGHFHVQVFMWTCFQFFWTGEKLLGHMTTQYLTFLGAAKLFSKVASVFYAPTSNIQEFQFFLHLCWHLLLSLKKYISILVGVK